MITVRKNLVIGGVDVHVREHNSKGFPVKYSHNLHYNNGFIFGELPKSTLVDLVATSGAQRIIVPNNQTT